MGGNGEEEFLQERRVLHLDFQPSGLCCCTHKPTQRELVVRSQIGGKKKKKKIRLEMNQSRLTLKALIIESWTFNACDRLVQPYQYLDNFPAKQASVTVWGRHGHFGEHKKKPSPCVVMYRKIPPKIPPFSQGGWEEEQKDRQTLLVFLFKSSRHQFRQQSGYSALKFYILFLMQTKLGALKIDAAT